jgi:hypothetical protein
VAIRSWCSALSRACNASRSIDQLIAPPGNTQIWIAAGVTDLTDSNPEALAPTLRRGFTGLSALVQVGPSLEKKGLRFDVKVLRAERQAKPPRAMLSRCG